MFNKHTYHQKLNTQWLGQTLLYFEELPSTSSYLKQLPSEKVAHGALCITDNQTRGRGQYERNWESDPAQNLTFTVAFKPTIPSRFHVLTMACAKAAVDLVRNEYALEACIKWPNDIMAEGRKIGGLLTETTFNGNRLDRLLVGIGLNINQTKFSDAIADKASSLKLLCGNSIERENFLADYLSRIEFEYSRWLRNKSDLLKEINQKIIGYGCWIKLAVNGDELAGKFKLIGINEQGQLTVVDSEGALQTFSYEQIRLVID